MKIRVRLCLLSLLFILTTTFASHHATKHIFSDHDSSECQICVVSHNFLSDDISVAFNELILFLSTETIFTANNSYKHQTLITKYSNAPPKIS